MKLCPVLSLQALSDELLLAIFKWLETPDLARCTRLCKGPLSEVALEALFRHPVVRVCGLYSFHAALMQDLQRVPSVRTLRLEPPNPGEPSDDNNTSRRSNSQIFEKYAFEYRLLPMVLQPFAPYLDTLHLPTIPSAIESNLGEALHLYRKLRVLSLEGAWSYQIQMPSSSLLAFEGVLTHCPLQKLIIRSFKFPIYEEVKTDQFINLHQITWLSIEWGYFDYTTATMRALFGLKNLKHLDIIAFDEVPASNILILAYKCPLLECLSIQYADDEEAQMNDEDIPPTYNLTAKHYAALGRLKHLCLPGEIVSSAFLREIHKCFWQSIIISDDFENPSQHIALLALLSRQTKTHSVLKKVSIPDDSFSDVGEQIDFAEIVGNYGVTLSFDGYRESQLIQWDD